MKNFDRPLKLMKEWVKQVASAVIESRRKESVLSHADLYIPLLLSSTTTDPKPRSSPRTDVSSNIASGLRSEY